jgi:hypothetical protein
MTIATRLKSAERQLNIGTGRLWENISLADFITQSLGDAPMSPGAERLNLYVILTNAPNMLTHDYPGRPEWRTEWLGYLSLTPDQCDRPTIDARCFEMATEAHFNAAEMRALRKNLLGSWGHVAHLEAMERQNELERAKAAAQPRPA